MNLVTRKEAAKAIYMSEGILSYWVRKGRLDKHEVSKSGRFYLVDLDQAKKLSKMTKRELLRESIPDNLISTKEAASLLHVTDKQITYYAKKGYIKKHYVLGNDKHYLVDRDEVLAQPELSEERIRHSWRLAELRIQAGTMKRDSRGWWVSNG